MMWRRLKMIGGALSQLGNVLTAFDLDRTGSNESISARMHRQGNTKRERLINAILRNPNHCREAHISDVVDAYALISEYERGG